MYQTFEHTADLGLRLQAASLTELFSEAAVGLMSILMEDPGSLQPRYEVPIQIESNDREYLLFDWLTELLYLFESRKLLVAKCEIRVDDKAVTGNVMGESCDPARHVLAHEVKAITYHQLSVQQVDSIWHAEVIVDI